ncbi:MAG: hypothetical protein H8D94_01000 [Candidatus Pelagibacter sp.]|nr:hypothetical protein [Candidatus Pelagibacter sp.]
MIKKIHALIITTISVLVIVLYANSIINELYEEIYELNRKLDSKSVKMSYWEHSDDWNKIIYREVNN